MSWQVDGSNTYKTCVLCISISLLLLEAAEWLESAIFCCCSFAVHLMQCFFPRALKVTCVKHCTLLRHVKIFHCSTDQPRKDAKTIVKKLSYSKSWVNRFLSRRVLKRERGMVLTNWTDCCYFKAWTFQRTTEIQPFFERETNKQLGV